MLVSIYGITVGEEDRDFALTEVDFNLGDVRTSDTPWPLRSGSRPGAEYLDAGSTTLTMVTPYGINSAPEADAAAGRFLSAWGRVASRRRVPRRGPDPGHDGNSVRNPLRCRGGRRRRPLPLRLEAGAPRGAGDAHAAPRRDGREDAGGLRASRPDRSARPRVVRPRSRHRRDRRRVPDPRPGRLRRRADRGDALGGAEVARRDHRPDRHPGHDDDDLRGRVPGPLGPG